MKKIITITVNSALDNEIEVENFEVGKDFRVIKESIYPSGKGINVARTISLLKHKVVSIAFTGHSTRDLFDSISSPYLKTINLITENNTRQNISIIDRDKGLVACIHRDGARLSNSEILILEKTVDKVVGNKDIVVISGSLPKKNDPKLYYNLIIMCKNKGARVIFDSCGEWLKNGIRANPYLIKPNIQELELLAGISFNDELSIVKYVQNEFKSNYVSIIIISLGEKGALIIDNRSNCVYKAWLKNQSTQKRTVGSGDAFIGGFAVSLRKEDNIQDSIRLSVACGAANQIKKGPGFIDKKIVKQLMEEVLIKKL